MTDEDLKDEILKAIVMLNDQTWEPKDFTARIIQLLKEEGYRPAFERYIGSVLEMRRLQAKYFNGDKSVLGKCKAAEAMVEKLTMANAKKMGIQSLDNIRLKYVQQTMF